jgi:dienelactone hydrolase
MRRLVPFLVVLALAAGCGGGGSASGPRKDEPLDEVTAALFADDPAQPLDVTEGETVDDVAYSIVGMSFRGRYDRVSGIVVRPRIPRPGAAGVIFMHGSGGTRADFLDEAVLLASRGAVAMTIDSPWARSPREEVRAGYADDATTRRLMLENVRDLRRGLDVLVEHYDVDPARLAVVGYSMGVQAAGLAASLDPRVRAVVLMAGRAHPSGRAGRRKPVFARLDTVHFVSHLAPAHLLLQGGTKDQVIGRAELRELFAAASEPKELRWYPAGHGLGLRSQRERIEWLSRELALG